MSANNQLLELQFIQLEHDKFFHPDILCLPVQKRACHMALHFAKYAGKLTSAKQNNDREMLIATLIDVFIICLTVGNMFNKKISDLECISALDNSVNITDISKKLALNEKIFKGNIFSYSSEMLTIEAGKIAKAIESLDHLESYPYKEAILSSLSKIVGIVFISFSHIEIDLYARVCSRLDAVEKKSIFYTFYRAVESKKSCQP